MKISKGKVYVLFIIILFIIYCVVLLSHSGNEVFESVEIIEAEKVKYILLIESPEKELKQFDLPDVVNGSFKSYMDYQMITSKSSEQYKMQQIAITLPNGCRMYDDRIMVAMGSFYATKCGDMFDITLSTGKIIKVIIGDLKQDIHTDDMNQYSASGNILEFIVDMEEVDSLVKYHGDMSHAGYYGDIVKIEEVK